MKSLLTALIAVIMSGALTLAQADNLIAYGETAQGEITVQEYEATYRFEGRAGDVIRAVMTPQNPHYGGSGSAWWNYPALLLLDADKLVIAELHSHDDVALIFELPATGEYHLIATGWYGRTDDNVGKYELLLEEVPELPAGAPLEGEASSDIGRHYIVRSDDSFSITYDYVDGAFRPELSVNVIAEDPYSCGLDTPNCSSDANGSNLHPVAMLSGLWLQSGTLEVKAHPAANGVYIVAVGKPRWSYFDSARSASFTLELNRSAS